MTVRGECARGGGGHPIAGRIGFDSVGETETWDQELRDTSQLPRDAGSELRPFAINTTTESLEFAFQLRGQVIKPNTFRGNFQALLREASGYPWIVKLTGVEQDPLDLWLQTSRTTSPESNCNFTDPNPRYPGKLLEDFFEASKLGAARVVARAQDGESIDFQSEGFLREAIRLARGLWVV